jgi:hypothetical protein
MDILGGDPTVTNVDPQVEITKWKRYCLIMLVITVVTLLLCGTYSLKKTTESQQSHSAGVTIKEPVEVAGKIVYRTIYQTVTDYIEKKQTLTIKSGCTLGLAISAAGHKGLWIVPELLPLGPGNVTAMTLLSVDEQWVGAGYRLNF